MFDQQFEQMFKTMLQLQTGTFKRMPNKERLEKYNAEVKEHKLILKNKKYNFIHQTCTTDCKVGTTNKKFNNDLKPITIKEMTLGTTYKNKYIKFEIVTDLMLMTSVMFLGKDDNGDLVLIAIYNFENHYGTRDYNKLSYIFQKGKYIIVLEPFYKMFGSGEDGIRIEDPNEIIIFDDKNWLNKFLEAENPEDSFKLFHDDEEQNYKFLYNEANKAFCIENYTIAVAHFIKLKKIKPDKKEFDIKIAECYFNIPYYSKAINMCDEILDDINKDDKNLSNIVLIKIKSLIKLKKISEAKDTLDKYKNIIQNKNEFSEIQKEINGKLKNMEGQYDFSEIYKLKDSFDINIGEYVNKKLEIKNI